MALYVAVTVSARAAKLCAFAAARPSAARRARNASSSISRAASAAASSGCPARPGGEATAAPAARASSSTRGMPSDAGHEDGGFAEQAQPAVGIECGADSRAAAERARQRRPRRRAGAHAGSRAPSPAVQRARARARAAAGARSAATRPRSASAWSPARVQVDAERDELVPAGEALRRGLARSRRSSRAVRRAGRAAARAAPGRRIREALGGEEGRDRQRVGVAEREVREARQPGLEAVHDVEAARRECDARGSRARRPGRPSGCAARSAPPGRGR